MKRIVFCIPAVTFFALDGLCQNDQRLEGGIDTNYILVMRSYRFEDGTSTDPMLVKQIIRQQEGRTSYSHNAVRQISVDSVFIIGCDDAGDTDVIKQFLRSLEFYNLWFGLKKRRGSVEHVLPQMFFRSIDEARTTYSMQWIEDGEDFGEIRLKHLAALSVYDFGRVLSEECNDVRCVITFTPHKTSLECSKKFYEEKLFPRYLNYISKNHRVTGYQIEMKKISWD